MQKIVLIEGISKEIEVILQAVDTVDQIQGDEIFPVDLIQEAELILEIITSKIKIDLERLIMKKIAQMNLMI